MEGEPDVQHLDQQKFCLTQLICLSGCSAKLQVFYGTANSKKEGIGLSVVCMLPCPLEVALPRQLKAVASSQTDKKILQDPGGTKEVYMLPFKHLTTEIWHFSHKAQGAEGCDDPS